MLEGRVYSRQRTSAVRQYDYLRSRVGADLYLPILVLQAPYFRPCTNRETGLPSLKR